jgi:hypothetical protein
MKATLEQIANSSYVPMAKDILRVSKSSYMTYKMCSRQYFWRYVADVPSSPPSDAMIRGTAIHNVMERGLLEGYDAVEQAAIDNDVVFDSAIDSLTSLIDQIADHFGKLDVVEAEVKHQVYDKFNEVEIIWVGMVDGILRHPDGGLILVELKTGNMNQGKLARTRQELCYYNMILQKLGYDEITHFLYIAPDYELLTDREDKLLLEGNKKGKEVWLGNYNGIAILEPLSSRSINAFKKALSKNVSSLILQDYPMNWNEFFCLEWCDFNSSCQDELLGLTGGMFDL